MTRPLVTRDWLPGSPFPRRPMGALREGMLFPLLSVLCLGSVAGLRITAVSVPAVVMSGARTSLSCSFRLQGHDQLYSLTWWKDGRMFFMYRPSSSRPITVYNTPGITVDVRNSTLQKVVLARVDHRASGKMRCEVLTDLSFEHDTKDANMTVIDPPSRGPVITGVRKKYQVGDLVLLNCSSPYSFPATSLAWLINGQLASHETVVLYPRERDWQGCESSWSGLQMLLRSEHFREGVLVLRCTASILHVYRHFAEVMILDPNYIPNPPLEGASTGGCLGLSLSLLLLLLSVLVCVLCT